MNSPSENTPLNSTRDHALGNATTGDHTAGDATTDSGTTGDNSNAADAADELMQAIDDQVAHVWMVRTFLKHSDEASEDEELASVHRDLYDFMLALGPALDAQDGDAYVKVAKKKLSKLRRATALFVEIQPEVSGHTNFKMAARSLQLAAARIEQWLQVA